MVMIHLSFRVSDEGCCCLPYKEHGMLSPNITPFDLLEVPVKVGKQVLKAASMQDAFILYNEFINNTSKSKRFRYRRCIFTENGYGRAASGNYEYFEIALWDKSIPKCMSVNYVIHHIAAASQWVAAHHKCNARVFDLCKPIDDVFQ